MTAPHELIPSARRLIRSLRDMGYDFSQAVADIVDNSVAAKSRRVDITLQFDGDDSWVRIADNGQGMTPAQLREALRFGADREYEEDDLGKFGLGLKTASMSQCQRLTVASRWNSDRADISAYAWDLGHITASNRWEILPVNPSQAGEVVRGPLASAPGTVVLWERLDRILGYQLPYGERARKRMLSMCRELEQHLGMVFHRFITGETGRRRLRISINGNELRPWDPFCRSEPGTRTLEPILLECEHEGVTGTITLTPYILPHQADFSSPEAFRDASGPRGWNQQQGFYIHRAGRLIQAGGWSNLRQPDEHTKLARIDVSFPPALDEAFKINVAKMRVQMPQQVRDEVRNAIASITKQARTVYDRKAAGGGGGAPRAAREKSVSVAAAGSPPAPHSPLAERDQRMTLEEWTCLFLSVAGPLERSVIELLLTRLHLVDGEGLQ